MTAALDVSKWSTDKKSLEPHSSHPVVKLLLEHQALDTLETTYVNGYLGTEDSPGALLGDRIHAEFVPYGTVTGRFSSRKPNLQNVPRPGSETATKVRRLFTAPAGHKLLVADYGQIELRVLAHFLGTGALYDGFHQGIDAHTATAALLFGVAWEDVTSKQRQVAKGINFAIVFGAGPDKVASMAGVTVREAKVFMAQHERLFPEIYRWKAWLISTCRAMPNPQVTTILGRVRRLPAIRYRNPELRSLAERQAVNSKVQGSAGDLIKIAMIRYHRSAPAEIPLTLTVHDELVAECPVDRVEEGAALLQDAMCGPGIQKLIRVPLVANAVVCDNWAQAK